MPTFNFNTGPATLPDIGKVAYNNCVFGPLFTTNVSSVFVKDDAERTVKWIEYTITLDGYVTLPDGQETIEPTMAALEKLLSAQGGVLIYIGRSLRLEINVAAGDRDVAWGPVPEILDIQPLGGGRSAAIKWTVKARVAPRLRPTSNNHLGPVLQFNYETTVEYDETGYSTRSLRGVVEIPLTRISQTDRRCLITVDQWRDSYIDSVMSDIDLKRFRVTNRVFTVSNDKRLLSFDVRAEELPWMALPPGAMSVRGNFTFRPATAGMGLATWLCTLSCTYTFQKDQPRRVAWHAFLALLRVRMEQGDLHGFTGATNQNPGVNLTVPTAVAFISPGLQFWRLLNAAQNAAPRPPQRKTFLIDLNGSEGLYLDSKTVTFSATWRLNTFFSRILLASGLWKRVAQFNENTWATSVSAISRGSSWLPNRVLGDAIVDFGS